jgi:hypothetical protein
VNPELKDWLQAIAWLAAGVGVVLAVFKFRSELQLTREQRERDLRWKQAEAAKELNDEMLDDPEARTALEMLDDDGREFDLPLSKQSLRITHKDLQHALNPENDDSDKKLADIRDCFDSLFYYFALLEHHINSTLVLHEDVAFPLDYYVRLLAAFRPEVEAYLDHFKLLQPKAFLYRYDDWKQAPKMKTSGPGSHFNH